MAEDLLSRLGEYEKLLVEAKKSAESSLGADNKMSLDSMSMRGRIVAYTEALNSLYEHVPELKPVEANGERK
jgi:hypothetical protein